MVGIDREWHELLDLIPANIGEQKTSIMKHIMSQVMPDSMHRQFLRKSRPLYVERE